ncbi:MAG: hypothetical protein IJP30_04145 [Clostridia bacterium]|nr:hypothetical protein [Clostridia bacterium]
MKAAKQLRNKKRQAEKTDLERITAVDVWKILCLGLPRAFLLHNRRRAIKPMKLKTRAYQKSAPMMRAAQVSCAAPKRIAAPRRTVMDK